MDDFTVYGSYFDACLDSLDRVLNICIETNIVLNFEKSHFMVEQGIVLGHIILNRGIEVDPAKIEVISQFPYPSYVREVHSFLGHGGFYRRFIRILARWPFHYPIYCKRRWSLILMTNAKRLLISSRVQ